MMKSLVVFITTLSLLSSPALANNVEIVYSRTKVQTPCEEVGYFSLPVCVVRDVTLEASAPRNDVIMDRRAAQVLGKKYKSFVVIYKLTTSPKYKNKDSVISVWSGNDIFIAQYLASELDYVSIVCKTKDGGKSWYTCSSPSKLVSFTLQY